MEIVKMKEVLRDRKRELKLIKDWVTINTAYKPKALKVRLINKNNRTRGISREKPD